MLLLLLLLLLLLGPSAARPWGVSSLVDSPQSLTLLSASSLPPRPLLLLVFWQASAFNQDLSSWNVGKVTDMHYSESSMRSLLLLLLLVGRGVLSSVYTSLSPPLSSPSLSCCCCGVFPLLVSPPLSLPLLSH